MKNLTDSADEQRSGADEVLLDVHQGQWGYSLNGGVHYPAKPVEFVVRAGDVVMLAGPNGAGKTTILLGLLGLVGHRVGHVFCGVPMEEIGYIRQESTIDRSVPANVMDVVRTGDAARWAGGRDQALTALKEVGLEGMEKDLFGRLSGGERQRVLIARSLMGRPRLLLLDEPTINVDITTAGRIGRLLARLAEGGLGVLVTSHVSGWVDAARTVTVQPSEPSS